MQTTSGLTIDTFGGPNEVKVVRSSNSRWFRPLWHVVITNLQGDIEEVWHDCTWLEAFVLSMYHKHRGWH